MKSTSCTDAKKLALSVLVPVYNERYLVADALARLKVLEQSEQLSHIEIIVVDDGSTDGTSEVLTRLSHDNGHRPEGSRTSWTFLRHERNRGKGEAIKTALSRASGDVCVIQDADLEYDPADIPRLLRPFLNEDADAVFGSRFAGGRAQAGADVPPSARQQDPHYSVQPGFEPEPYRRVDRLQGDQDRALEVHPD
jgi:glycosyltransferase involved in cell wall biosynthesis